MPPKDSRKASTGLFPGLGRISTVCVCGGGVGGGALL